MLNRYGIILITVIVIAVFSVGCCGSSTTAVDGKGSTGSAVSSSNNLELIESNVENGDYGMSYIVGKIKNNAGKTYSYVQVEINLYDSSGFQIGSTLDNLNNLEPGGIWKFKAMVLQDGVTDYKVKEITGF